MARRKGRGYLRAILALLVVAGIVVLFKGAFGAGPEPTLLLESDLPAIGKRTVIRVVADEPVERVRFLQARLQFLILFAEFAGFECFLYRQFDFIDFERLGHVVAGALLQRLDGGLH